MVTGPQTGAEGSLHEAVRERGIEVVVVDELRREVSPRHDLAVVPALERLFRERRFDVVHTNSSKAGVVGRVAARRAEVPTVIHTIHGWPFHDHQSQPVSAIWRRLERWAAPKADRLVVVAEADRIKGLAAGVGQLDQYVLVRSGLELDLYAADARAHRDVRDELGIPASARVVGAVNRLSPQKDPLALVEAFTVVARARDDAWLVVVGDGPLRDDLQRRAAALGVEDRLVLTGLRTDVPRLLAAMDVFVSASRWEGLPRTVIAAMASGVPVVATPADGVVDVVADEQTGLVAAVGRPELLGSQVLRVLSDEALARGLSARAAERVQEFDAREMVRRLEGLYGAGPRRH